MARTQTLPLRTPADVLDEAARLVERLRRTYPAVPVSDEVWRWSVACWLSPRPHDGHHAAAWLVRS